ncbi:unnamed protein product [Ceratitis capitata]|uniref:(Mediterranean fruit fly) hypothetical protein n=1 Tax=Ceratitis capitata TaxID=7213 RepID=A0A811UUX5_CERCA|nr:unnamed protein product [Ceratitis capitata]
MNKSCTLSKACQFFMYITRYFSHGVRKHTHSNDMRKREIHVCINFPNFRNFFSAIQLATATVLPTQPHTAALRGFRSAWVLLNMPYTSPSLLLFLFFFWFFFFAKQHKNINIENNFEMKFSYTV